MKKIGVLTLYYNNFNMGGLLQAYALQKILELTGFDTEQISFDFTWHYGNGGKVKKLLKEFRNFLGITSEKKVDNDFQIRMQKFQEFMETIPHSKRIYYATSEFAKKYDAVVVGSDQVWAEWLPKGALKVFLLSSPKMNGKRYSYAVSLGMDVLSANMQRLFAVSLSTFENISVRESSNKAVLQKKLPNKNISNNLDPTLLLGESEWYKLAKKPQYKKPYLFCYFLGKNKSYRDAATRLAKEMKLHIVSIPYAKDHKKEGFDDSFGDYIDYSCGPMEFIGWISSAEAVLTDSFHATVFSCQFRKRFLALSRKNELGITSMNKRITDFLDLFELSDHYLGIDSLNNLSYIEKPNYELYNKKISVLRDKSLEYLITTLNKGLGIDE